MFHQMVHKLSPNWKVYYVLQINCQKFIKQVIPKIMFHYQESLLKQDECIHFISLSI